MKFIFLSLSNYCDEICTISYIMARKKFLGNLEVIASKNFNLRVEGVTYKLTHEDIKEFNICENDFFMDDNAAELEYNAEEIFDDLNGSRLIFHNSLEDILLLIDKFNTLGMNLSFDNKFRLC